MSILQSGLLRDYGVIGHKYVPFPCYDENIRNRVKLGPNIQNLSVLLKLFLLCNFLYKYSPVPNNLGGGGLIRIIYKLGGGGGPNK